MGHYFMVLKASKAMVTGFWYQKYLFIPVPASPYFCFISISPRSIFLSLLKYPLSSEFLMLFLFNRILKILLNTSKFWKKITIKLKQKWDHMLLVSLSYLLWFRLWKLLKFLLLTKKYLSSCPRHLSRDGIHLWKNPR